MMHHSCAGYEVCMRCVSRPYTYTKACIRYVCAQAHMHLNEQMRVRMLLKCVRMRMICKGVCICIRAHHAFVGAMPAADAHLLACLAFIIRYGCGMHDDTLV